MYFSGDSKLLVGEEGTGIRFGRCAYLYNLIEPPLNHWLIAVCHDLPITTTGPMQAMFPFESRLEKVCRLGFRPGYLRTRSLLRS